MKNRLNKIAMCTELIDNVLIYYKIYKSVRYIYYFISFNRAYLLSAADRTLTDEFFKTVMSEQGYVFV